MASYEEDHGINSSHSSSQINNNINNNQQQNGGGRSRLTLSQQPDLINFFDMDREEDDDDDDNTHRLNFNLNEAGNNVNSPQYIRGLMAALENYVQVSPVAQELFQQLQSELEESNSNTQNRNRNRNNNGSQIPSPPISSLSPSSTISPQLLQLLSNSNNNTNGLDFLTQQQQEQNSNSNNQHLLDSLDRVSKKWLHRHDNVNAACPICATRFLDDPYPLVVALPCNTKHKFDLECIAPWLALHPNCPLCRKDLIKKKEIPQPVQQADEEEEEEFDDFYS